MRTVSKPRNKTLLSPQTVQILMLVALVQGFILLLLHQSIELDFWPHHSPHWLFSFYSMAFAGPILLLLGVNSHTQLLKVAKWVVLITLVFGLAGFYVGYQTTPIEHIRYERLLFATVFTLAIALFKVLMYLQQLMSGRYFSYSQLFVWSWRNFLTLALSLLFAGCFWGVLILWAALFKAININFFYDLFHKPWFYYPAIALAHGFGVIIFRQLSHIIDTITRIQQALMKFLLVLVVFVAMIFLVGLMFSGLTPLWESGGSTLILWMQALTLFFVNAVYQDDAHERPYPVWLHRFIYGGIALLPIYSVISCYGLMLRIDQYGWSIARCWGMLVWFLLTSFSLGYLWGIIKQQDNWLTQLSRVNVMMGGVVLTLMLLVNSPLLDFRKIAVADQITRLQSGQIQIDDFDVYYFRRQLARPGYLALQDLKVKYAEVNPKLVSRINALYADQEKDEASLYQDFLRDLVLITPKMHQSTVNVVSNELPDELTRAVFKRLVNNRWQLQQRVSYYFMPLDANNDGVFEYLLVEDKKSNLSARLYYLTEGEWRSDFIRVPTQANKNKAAVIAELKQGQFKLVPPQWQNIQLGGYLFKMQ